MKKLLILLPFDEVYRDKLQKIATSKSEVIYQSPSKDSAEYFAALKDADIIIGDPSPADLAYCKKLSLLQTTWAGIRQYLDADCFQHGATLCNMSGAYGPVIAEHEMGMILTLCRRFPAYCANMKRHAWEKAGDAKTLEGASVLIVGAGDIGQALAERLRPFVDRIVGVRRVSRKAPTCFDSMISLAELDAALPQSDIVACSMPDTPETNGLFDYERLCRMKRDAILVNVGRGTLIRSDDLARAMTEGRFFGVGLDVTEPEPLPQQHPLWEQERLLITPHVSGNDFGSGSPTERRMWDFSLMNVDNYLAGKPLKNIVDFATGYRSLQ